jgi:hypothetical protein
MRETTKSPGGNRGMAQVERAVTLLILPLDDSVFTTIYNFQKFLVCSHCYFLKLGVSASLRLAKWLGMTCRVDGSRRGSQRDVRCTASEKLTVSGKKPVFHEGCTPLASRRYMRVFTVPTNRHCRSVRPLHSVLALEGGLKRKVS